MDREDTRLELQMEIASLKHDIRLMKKNIKRLERRLAISETIETELKQVISEYETQVKEWMGLVQIKNETIMALKSENERLRRCLKSILMFNRELAIGEESGEFAADPEILAELSGELLAEWQARHLLQYVRRFLN